MTTNETLGIAIFVIVLLIATWQWAFALGRDVGANTERLLGDRRVRGVLAEVAKQKPSGRVAQRKRLAYRKVNPRHVTRKRSLNTRLPGTEVIA